jgi:hypothetical protein
MDQTIYAFPTDENADFNNKGMPLRDYFAARAMQSFIITDTDCKMDQIASFAYMMADIMMEERDAHQDGTR